MSIERQQRAVVKRSLEPCFRDRSEAEIRDSDEQPEEEAQMEGDSRQDPRTGASVPVELGRATLQVWMCSTRNPALHHLGRVH